MTESALAEEKEVVGSIGSDQPIAVPFTKTFITLLAKIDAAYNEERGKTVREEFEGLKLDQTLGWQIDFNAKTWIGRKMDAPPQA